MAFKMSKLFQHKEQGKMIIDIWYIIYLRVDFTLRCAWSCHHVRLRPQWENYGTKAWETNFLVIRHDDPLTITEIIAKHYQSDGK